MVQSHDQQKAQTDDNQFSKTVSWIIAILQSHVLTVILVIGLLTVFLLGAFQYAFSSIANPFDPDNPLIIKFPSMWSILNSHTWSSADWNNLGTGGETSINSGYKAMAEEACQKYGVSQYLSLVLAVMQQESGGTGGDPMQCSECGYNEKFPHKPNSITDPAYSIQCGVQYLSACLRAAKCKSPTDMDGIKLAIQGYNFGNGYISWAQQKYGKYTYANATEFSRMMAAEEGWSGYGDINYVPHVLRYYNSDGGSGSFSTPIKAGQYTISSPYGDTSDRGKPHRGIDFAATAGTPIYAASSGTVIYAQYGTQPYGGYGNLVIIRHGSSLVSMYAHCSRLLVSPGQIVHKGDLIAKVGSTGDSTGPHCHFEIRLNNQSVDPNPYLKKA